MNANACVARTATTPLGMARGALDSVQGYGHPFSQPRTLDDLFEHPQVRACGSERYWQSLREVATSYAQAVWPRALAGDAPLQEAMIAWLTYFWHLDTLVDEHRDGLPHAGALEHLTLRLQRVWEHADELPPPPAQATSFEDDLDNLARIFLGHHLQVLRSRGLGGRAMRTYRRSVSEHIASQLEPTWIFGRLDGLDDYIECRRRQSGMECIFRLLIMLVLGDCPPSLDPLIDLANISTSLSNDLFSHDRDAEEQIPNLMDYMPRHNGLARACELTESINNRLRGLIRAIEPQMESGRWLRLQEVILGVVHGMMRWHCVEPRYETGAKLVMELWTQDRPPPAVTHLAQETAWQ